MPAVFDYDSYREFLSAYYEYRKKSGDFSFEKFSALVGLRSRSFLKLVIGGSRDLSSELAFLMAKALGLDFLEHRYFEILVLENQTTHPEHKRYYARLLKDLRRERRVVKSHVSDPSLLDYPFFLAVFTLLSESDAGESFEDLQKKLKCAARPLQQLLQQLLKEGRVSEAGGMYRTTATFTHFHDKKDWKRKQHQFLVENLKKSVTAVNKPGSQAKMHSLVFSGDWQKIREYQEKIQELLTSLSEEHHTLKPADSELLQLNVQVFPYHAGH